MATRLARTVLRLDAHGRWTRSPPTSLNLVRHPPPPPSSRAPAKDAFETLANDTTPVPSIQAVPSPPAEEGAAGADAGGRLAVPAAGAVPVPAAGQAVLDRDLTFHGVRVPKRPQPPAEGECCMSGCATCVYDLYLDDLEHFHAEARNARSEVLSRLRRDKASREGQKEAEGTDSLAEWPEEELGPRPTRAELRADIADELSTASTATATAAGSGPAPDAGAAAAREAAEARAQISDPTLKAFLEMEARMKAKQKQQQQQQQQQQKGG
ncbi:hypothetical protein JCM8202_006268 [Rhodotorula sphaerocarpa]